MTTTRLTVLLAVVLATASGTASAQTAVSCAECQAPNASPHHPRLYRLLEVVTEPSLLVRPSPYPGYVPSNRPLLDAAPNLSNLVFLGLYGINSTPLTVASFVVPTALRALRVGLYGPPFTMTRRETALWIVLPALVHLNRTYQATGFYLEKPLYARLGLCRPLFPRLRVRGR